jgi:hypothetical protein
VVIDPHRLAEERSLAIHRLVADKLKADPRLVAAARERVAGWLADGSVHPVYAEAWHVLLAGPLERLIEGLLDPGEHGRALRQCSPFAGIVDARTRWAIWREVRERFAS